MLEEEELGQLGVLEHQRDSATEFGLRAKWIKDVKRDSSVSTFAVTSIDVKQSVEYTFSTNIHGELPRGTWTA